VWLSLCPVTLHPYLKLQITQSNIEHIFILFKMLLLMYTNMFLIFFYSRICVLTTTVWVVLCWCRRGEWRQRSSIHGHSWRCRWVRRNVNDRPPEWFRLSSWKRSAKHSCARSSTTRRSRVSHCIAVCRVSFYYHWFDIVRLFVWQQERHLACKILL